MRVEAEHRFAVPVHDAFGYITDQANWPEYWPGFVRIDPGSRWSEADDVTRIVIRVLGRERELVLTLRRFEPDRRVEYTSIQSGLPDLHHDRRFEDADGELHFRAAVEFAPRGLYDRIVVRRAIARALRATIANLDAAFERSKLNA